MRTLILVATCFLFSGQAIADLPQSVLKMVKNRREEIKQVLSLASKEQQELLLERFAALLPKSDLFLFEPIDGGELLAYLKAQFPFDPPSPKGAQIKSEWLEGLSRKLGARMREGIIDLDFKCSDGVYRFPFLVENNRDAFQLKVRGIELPTISQKARDPAYCLEIQVSTLRKSLRIENLKTQTVACALPSERAGECLLNLAEWIGEKLGAERSTLADFTKVRCSRNSAFTDLRRLKIFKDGQGWYEKRGYVQQNLSDDVYGKRLNDFKGYTIEALRTNLNDKKVGTEQIELFDVHARRYFENRTVEPTFSAFMKWLWEDDCRAYMEIENFIFLKKNGLEIAKLYPEVYDFVKPLNPR